MCYNLLILLILNILNIILISEKHFMWILESIFELLFTKDMMVRDTILFLL